MTFEEAKAIAKIISTADNGCTNCIASLADELNRAKLGWFFRLIPCVTWERAESKWDPEYKKSYPMVNVVPLDPEEWDKAAKRDALNPHIHPTGLPETYRGKPIE